MLHTIPLALGFLLSAPPSTTAEPTPAPRELIGDPRFDRGCVLWDPKPGKHVKYGEIRGVDKSKPPVWGLAQWSSRERLEPGPARPSPGGGRRYANNAKAVTFGPLGSDDADAALAVFGSFEYDKRARKQGEPWAHLLLEQAFNDPPSLDELTEARLHVEARMKLFRKLDAPDYSPSLHAAQNQIFFTISNLNRESPGYGQHLWFGVPLFDDRARFTKGYQAQDTAVDNGMFIYTIPGDALTSRSLHDEGWAVIDGDLLPHMLKGLETAWSAGFLNDSRSPADYRVTGMNMGWEVPGVFDVEIQHRNLSLKIVTEPSAD